MSAVNARVYVCVTSRGKCRVKTRQRRSMIVQDVAQQRCAGLRVAPMITSRVPRTLFFVLRHATPRC